MFSRVFLTSSLPARVFLTFCLLWLCLFPLAGCCKKKKDDGPAPDEALDMKLDELEFEGYTYR